jgi:hypothetical protein
MANCECQNQMVPVVSPCLGSSRRQLAGGLGEGPGRSGGPEGKQGAVHGGARRTPGKLGETVGKMGDLGLGYGSIPINTILGG